MGGPRAASSLKRFYKDVLPAIAGGSSDLIFETWKPTGSCGKVEKQAVKHVRKTIKRPQVTESELVRAIKLADKFGVRPHILSLSCKNYIWLRPKGKLSYARFLTLTGKQLLTKLRQVKRGRDEMRRKAAGRRNARDRKIAAVLARKQMVLVYGGALHNDRKPLPVMAPYAYGNKLGVKDKTERYVEIDLLVPEYILGDQDLLKGQPWFAKFKRDWQDPRKFLNTTVYKRGERSYVVLLPRTKQPTAITPSK